MKTTVYQDSISALLAIVGGITVFAKLESYSWWLIGSWKGALGVLAVLGLGMMLTNVQELLKLADGAAITEFSLWLVAATVTIASLFATTNKAEFLWSSAAIGVAWLAQFSHYLWHLLHTPPHHYSPAH